MRSMLSAFSFLFVFWSSTAFAQQGDAIASGLVRAGAAPIENALVGIYSEPEGALVAVGTSDANGRFVLEGLASGTYLLKIEHLIWANIHCKI